MTVIPPIQMVLVSTVLEIVAILAAPPKCQNVTKPICGIFWALVEPKGQKVTILPFPPQTFTRQWTRRRQQQPLYLMPQCTLPRPRPLPHMGLIVHCTCSKTLHPLHTKLFIQLTIGMYYNYYIYPKRKPINKLLTNLYIGIGKITTLMIDVNCVPIFDVKWMEKIIR